MSKILSHVSMSQPHAMHSAAAAADYTQVLLPNIDIEDVGFSELHLATAILGGTFMGI